jgi:hypothetical protein
MEALDLPIVLVVVVVLVRFPWTWTNPSAYCTRKYLRIGYGRSFALPIRRHADAFPLLSARLDIGEFDVLEDGEDREGWDCVRVVLFGLDGELENGEP